MRNRIAALFNEDAEKLAVEFRRSTALQHNGSKGAARENFLLSLLHERLPGNVRAVGSCEVIDVDGNFSPQTDIAIVDPSIPPLFTTGSHSLIPVECLYGTVEVKSRLTVDALIESCDKFAATARMEKTAYFPAPQYEVRNKAGGRWSSWPTVGHIFGYDGACMATLFEAFGHWCARHPAEERPSNVWVFRKGCLFWSTPNALGVHVPPMANTVLNSNVIESEGHILGHLIHALHSDFARATIPPFQLSAYLQGESFGLKGHWSSEREFGRHPDPLPCQRPGGEHEI